MKPRPALRIMAAVVGSTALAGLIFLACVPLGGSEAEAWRWLGRSHVLFVHFPIGLLLVVPCLELAGRRWPHARTAAGIVLLLGVLSAYVASGVGLALAHADAHAGAGVERHLWGGVAAVGLASVAAFTRWVAWTRMYVASLLATIGVIGWAAHQGGNLVHGQYYLTEGLPSAVRTVLRLPEPPKPEIYSKDTVFGAGVAPMLERTCLSCHGPAKQKGDYRVDNMASLTRGGQSGLAALVPHRPNESELLRRLRLPPGDRKAMPPQGQPRPREAEVALLAWWIAQGARPAMSLAEAVQADSDFETLFRAALTPEPVIIELPKVGDYAALAATIPSLARELGMTIQPISKRPGDGLLVRARNARISGATLARLASLAPYIVEVEFTDSALDQEAFVVIGSFRALETMNLAGSTFPPLAVQAVVDLPRLAYVNGHGTPLNDAALDVLSRLKAPRAVYSTRSEVTDAGRERFRNRHPGCELP